MKDCVEGDYYSELNLEEVEKDYLTDEHSDDDDSDGHYYLMHYYHKHLL